MAGNRNYPLSVLFVLLTSCAVMTATLAALAPSLAANRADIAHLIGVIVGIGFSGLLLGVIVGLYHFQRSRGILVGGLAGLAVGICVGPLVFVQLERSTQLLTAQLGGAVVLVMVAAGLRYISGKSSGRQPVSK